MRMVVIAALAAAGLAAASGAEAQRRSDPPGARYPAPDARFVPPPPTDMAPPYRRGDRADYPRPVRGERLPPYLTDGSFRVTDWRRYDLPEPPAGYEWIRYYDDAALIDTRGAVYDVEPDIDWDRYAGARPVANPTPYTATLHGDGRWVSPDGTTTVVTGTGGHVSPPYPGGGVTTVTVRTQPVVTTTTTTTEYHDDVVTYSRPAKRAYRQRGYARPAYRSKLRPR